MERILRIGVLGCSRFAQRMMIPAIQALPQRYALAGIASRTREDAERCAKRFDTQAYRGYRALLDSPLDAVYIPLPNALHAQWALAAMERDLHVFVEKPLACNAGDVAALCRLAESKALVLLENFQFRFHRQLARIQRLVADGVLGELRSVRASFGFPPLPDATNIRYQQALGGGGLLDAGVYPIRLCQELLGHNLRVSAARWYLDQQRGIDIWGGGFIEQQDGPLFAEIVYGMDNHYQCSLEVWGSRGKLVANRIFTPPPTLSPTLVVETPSGVSEIAVPADDHTRNILTYFHNATLDASLRRAEYGHNIRQAQLIEQFRLHASA